MSDKNHKIFIVAGEASGDNYGALFARESTKIKSVEIIGWGGDQMSSQGVTITKYYNELAFMGFWEVLKNLKTITRNIKKCWEEIQDFNPDALVLVDFPGFNMRIAKKAKAAGIKTYQIICPQIWAWKASRINALKRDYNAVFPTLPFEDQILKNGGVNSQSFGHPIIDTLDDFVVEKDPKLIALLPGSRKQELNKILPVFIETTRQLDGYNFIIAGAPGLTENDYSQASKAGIKVEFGQTREILAKSQAAIITSGTATLEAALLGTKHIIAYKTGAFNYTIARLFINVKHIGLPNLIVGEEVVPELIQGDCNTENIAKHLEQILSKDDQLKSFAHIRKKLGEPGASKRIASYILKDSLGS
ncbi:MAG: lipid-A-disaccharide synthase [Crocinitomicaceae bacterium]|nr:lipid-A-disaccharide synthase [Crocinitomicaceae bacterium]|tara:strand:+ start:1699 stop:2781 length:1083 start_codon:yes stop_codon:yes gene_type:complete